MDLTQVDQVLVLEDPVVPPRVPLEPGRDVWWHQQVTQQPGHCPPEWMDAEAPLFLLYTR